MNKEETAKEEMLEEENANGTIEENGKLVLIINRQRRIG